MAVSCYFLLLLALSPSLSMAALPNGTMMRESSRFLSDRFQQLRRNGLGVEHMKNEYRSTLTNYSTLDDDGLALLENLFIRPQIQTSLVYIHRDVPTKTSQLGNLTTVLPDCCSSSGSCCYNCDGEDDPDSIVDELFTNISTSFRDARFMMGEGIEVQAGLETGELLDFQHYNVRSSYCPSIDPRLTPWYSRVTNTSQTSRYIVVFLNLNDAANNTMLKQAALKVIGSLSKNDMVALVIVGTQKQRLCPSTFTPATELQKWILSRIVREELLDTTTRNYQRAFNETNALFNSIISINFDLKFLIIITDDSEYNFDGAKFNNIPQNTQNPPNPPNAFRSLVYSRESSSNYILGLTPPPVYQLLSDVDNYLSYFIGTSTLSKLAQVYSDYNAHGDLCISATSNIIISDVFRGVVTSRAPWKLLYDDLDMTVSDRPNSYYFIVKGDGVMLYHSRYPKVYVPDIDPTTIETSEAFPTIMSAIINGQNESLPFNNTLIYSNNGSYYVRNVPSTYYCYKTIDNSDFNLDIVIPFNDIYACLALADEDQSILDTFKVPDIAGSYNGRSKPVYHSLLSDSSSGSCTDYCQLTSSSSLALQLTTPMTPPTTSSLRNFQQYIDGTLRDSTFDDTGIAEEVSVHSKVGEIWLDNDNASIVRRYLTTPSGIFLSYRGIQLVDGFDPKSLSSYIVAVTNDDTLSLTPAYMDPLFPEVGVVLYSASEALRSSYGENNPLLSVISADISMSSLRDDVNMSLGKRYCGINNTECTVITNDGYFVLLPDGAVPPLHITEHSDYHGITLFMITNGILVKTACNNLDNFAINHERFYYVNSSAISATGCYTPTTGCRDFCIQPINGTSGYLIVSFRKSTCGGTTLQSCALGQTVCKFCSSFTSNLQCPCACERTDCENTTTALMFPACPVKSVGPVNYTKAQASPTIPSSVMSCTQNCANQTMYTCSPFFCSWCPEQNSCLPLGTCCVSTPTCCNDPSIMSLPSCLRDQCTAPPVPTVTTEAPTTASNLPIILGLTFGFLAAFIIAALLVACFLWNVFCRVADSGEAKRKSDFNFNEPVKAINKKSIEMDNIGEDGEDEKNGGEKIGIPI